MTSGDPRDPIPVEVRRSRGRRRTSSFECEVSALALAMDWIDQHPEVPKITLCVDSQAVLTSLLGERTSDSAELFSVRRRLATTDKELTIQWVPSHVGIRGNEWADAEANVAAGRSVSSSRPVCRELVINGSSPEMISFSAATSALRSFCLHRRDPGAAKPRLQAIFGLQQGDLQFFHSPPFNLSFRPPPGFPAEPSSFFPPVSFFPSSRSDCVLLSQLRSGHCSRLRAYASVVNPLADPTCPLCQEGSPQDLEHVFQSCPALSLRRISFFGVSAPPLSVLSRACKQVVPFLRGSGLR